MSEWYYLSEGQRHGPISDTELQALLKSGEIGKGIRVWRLGYDDWVPITATRPAADVHFDNKPPPTVRRPPLPKEKGAWLASGRKPPSIVKRAWSQFNNDVAEAQKRAPYTLAALVLA